MLQAISIHALLAESDRDRRIFMPKLRYFYPRSPCGERLFCIISQYLYNKISIHALLAESDAYMTAANSTRRAFLSTLSLRRATTRGQGTPVGVPYFYPRSPCGERPVALMFRHPRPMYFYPRSPCGERLSVWQLRYMRLIFLSTLSLRRATISMAIAVYAPDISIHALLAESDTEGVEDHVSDVAFLSTLSLRRATGALFAYLALRDISIHALLAESDVSPYIHSRVARNFYPRSPCGERQQISGLWREQKYFYPRSPCGERPHLCPQTSCWN